MISTATTEWTFNLSIKSSKRTHTMITIDLSEWMTEYQWSHIMINLWWTNKPINQWSITQTNISFHQCIIKQITSQTPTSNTHTWSVNFNLINDHHITDNDSLIIITDLHPIKSHKHTSITFFITQSRINQHICPNHKSDWSMTEWSFNDSLYHLKPSWYLNNDLIINHQIINLSCLSSSSQLIYHLKSSNHKLIKVIIQIKSNQMTELYHHSISITKPTNSNLTI